MFSMSILWKLFFISSAQALILLTETNYAPNLTPNGKFVYKSPCSNDICAQHLSCNYFSEKNGTYCIFGQVTAYEATNEMAGYVKGSGDACPASMISDSSYFSNLPKDQCTYCNISSCNYTGLESALGYCYRVVASSVNFDTAHVQCLSLGANLASVHSQAEYEYIRGMIRDCSWIGANRTTGGDLYAFTNLDNTPSNFFAWHKVSPDRLDQNCIMINYYDLWDDNWCYKELPFVCKKAIF